MSALLKPIPCPGPCRHQECSAARRAAMAMAEAQAAQKVEAVAKLEQIHDAPKVARPAVKARKATVVTRNAVQVVTPISAVTKNANASRKRGRPRVLSDEQRRERVRQRVAGWRAAKAGKAAAR